MTQNDMMIMRCNEDNAQWPQYNPIQSMTSMHALHYLKRVTLENWFWKADLLEAKSRKEKQKQGYFAC